VQIAVVGTGYVGLVVGACLAETGNNVVCADIDAQKIGMLRENRIPIFEPGLQDLVERNQEQHRLSFTVDVAGAVAGCEVVFIAVGTPPDGNGSADLRRVLEVAETIGQHMTRETVVVTKSTVPVGTALKVQAVVERWASYPFHMCSNPEFLKEGAAVEDFLRPDRVVLGVESDHARSVMTELYSPFVRTGRPIIFMSIASAEMTKYAANAMLATRISFMNEIANLCERAGADIDLVRKGIGSDSRIGPSFLFPGPGYGGSCFPKDVKALIHTAREYGATLSVLEAVECANQRQKSRLFEKLRSALGDNVRGAHIAIWGLAFKPNTDDMREAPSVALIEALASAGATATAHDPAAMTAARRLIGDVVRYAESSYEALDGADALVIVTDWNEYRHPDFHRMKSALRQPIVIDSRNLYRPEKMKLLGFTYDSIGRGPAEAVHNELAATLTCHTDQITSLSTESASHLEAPRPNFDSALLEDRYDAPSTARLA
jgi:UDPglucose 6-dehydrogenase